ncbi:tyrosine-type recombinase/integrase [Candidatus Bathyarchaeota archaeon]|nr:tyrosine-type recombinase/integrase [Candidatus Bathyarchaeota archaeon]
MKKDGYAESTIKTTGKRLRMMAREGVNLDDPNKVKEYIATKVSSNGYKGALCDVYSRYLRYNGLTWFRPRYERDDQPPYVPTEEEIDILIANAGRKYSLLLSLIKDTGMRPIEVERTRVRWFDLQRGSINVQTAKHGLGRTLELRPQTLAMLKEYLGTHDLGLNDRIFAKVKTIRGEFRHIKHRTAWKLQRPELLRISLYSLRHFFGTMTYHRTKDILYTQRKMGHRNLKNTLVYTHLVNFKSDDYIVRVAETVEEACKLVEAGFEYVTEIDNVQIFRKPR